LEARYAAGLRGILASVETEHLDDAALVGKLRALRDDAPVKLEFKFWGAQFLAMAFGHELGFAAAHPPALRAIFNLGVAAAEQGLVPYQAIRGAHGQLSQLGLLHCERVDPPPAAGADGDGGGGALSSAATSAAATPWELFASQELRVAARKAAAGLQSDGAAVVDGVLGPRLAAAVSRALVAHAAESRHAFKPG
jgi:hypothetical protein